MDVAYQVSTDLEPLSAAHQQALDLAETLLRENKIPRTVYHELYKAIKKLAELDEKTYCLKAGYFFREVNQFIASTTPLWNPDWRDRRLSEEEEEERRRRSKWIAVWAIDLGNFKHTNDVLGHLTGDRVLKRIGRILRVTTRHRQKVDVAARIGGDEFAALLTHLTSPVDAYEAAKRFQNRVKEAKWARIHPDLESVFPPRPDMGVVAFKMESVSTLRRQEDVQRITKLLYHHADQLMYQSKAAHGEIFFRTLTYDRYKEEIVESETEIYKLRLNLVEDGP